MAQWPPPPWYRPAPVEPPKPGEPGYEPHAEPEMNPSEPEHLEEPEPVRPEPGDLYRLPNGLYTIVPGPPPGHPPGGRGPRPQLPAFGGTPLVDDEASG